MNPSSNSVYTTVTFRLDEETVLTVKLDGEFADIDHAEYVALNCLWRTNDEQVTFLSCKTEYISY